MSRIAAIASRELRAYFLSPGGYIIIGLFLLITGGFFTIAFDEGQVSSLRAVFGVGAWLLSFIAPAITMRLLSEEFRMGTFEMLSTSPLNETHIVLGKFLGAMGFVVAMLAPTLVYVIAMEQYGRPDYGELACGYLGLVLAAAAYAASGLFASTLTASQAVAFLITMFFWLTLLLGTKLLPQYLPAQLGDRWTQLLYLIDPDLRLRDFTIGLVDTSNIVFFLTIAACFLVAAIKSLEYRRMR